MGRAEEVGNVGHGVLREERQRLRLHLEELLTVHVDRRDVVARELLVRHVHRVGVQLEEVLVVERHRRHGAGKGSGVGGRGQPPDGGREAAAVGEHALMGRR